MIFGLYQLQVYFYNEIQRGYSGLGSHKQILKRLLMIFATMSVGKDTDYVTNSSIGTAAKE